MVGTGGERSKVEKQQLQEGLKGNWVRMARGGVGDNKLIKVTVISTNLGRWRLEKLETHSILGVARRAHRAAKRDNFAQSGGDRKSQ